MNITKDAYAALKAAACDWYALGLPKTQNGLFLLQCKGYVSFRQEHAAPGHYAVTSRGYDLIERLGKTAQVQRPIRTWRTMVWKERKAA